jgi:hypothetical protein
VLAALNAQADQIVLSLTYQPLHEVVMGLAGVSAVIWTAMAAAWRIGSESTERVHTSRDIMILIAVLALSFLPLSFASQGGLLLCACYLLATATRGSPEWRAALVLLALTGPLIWGRLLLHLFAMPILSLDAYLVGTASGTQIDGNVVRFANGSGQFIIRGPCSSVHNISLALVLWTTAAMMFRIRVDRAYVLVGIAMVGFMFALNVVRLSAMALFPSQFDYLHFGTGGSMFGWAGLIGAGVLVATGVMHAAARQH